MTPRPSKRPARGGWIDRLDEVESAGDRRASMPLLDIFLARGAGALDDERAAEVADVLVALEDPRCAPALLEAALDAARPPFRRALAVQVLASIPVNDPPRERCLAWAGDRDAILRALGLQYLDAADGERIAAALGDPDVLVRRTATEALGALVRTPPLVTALRRGLRDDDAIVREIACRVALFDEPLDVSWDLLRVLTDPSHAVRVAAFEALTWYPRVSVLLALADARTSAAGDPATEALGALVRRLVEGVSMAEPAVKRRVERWAAPAAWLIDEECKRLAREDAKRTATHGEVRESPPPPNSPYAVRPTTPASERRTPVDLADALRKIDDAETPPLALREVLSRRSWSRTGARGVAALRRCVDAPNWSLRQLAARPLAELDAAEEIARLASDEEPVVRRAAFLASLDTDGGVSPALLDAARAALDDPSARPVAGDPALAVLAAHGTVSEIEGRVVRELSRSDDRDGLFLGATHLARYGGIRRAVAPLLGIVNAPIVGQVRTHIAALQALRSLGHARARIDLSHLEDIDHLDVVSELAEWRWRGSRW